MSNAHRTAIARSVPSVPMRALKAFGRIVGRTLDYGCGRGCDARTYGLEYFDPHYSPVMPEGRFDTIVCNYVLNVIESAETRISVLRDIQARLADGGRAYITVRTDKAALNGTTRTGTWQGLVVLDLPIVQRGPGYVTYALDKSTPSEQLEHSVDTLQAA